MGKKYSDVITIMKRLALFDSVSPRLCSAFVRRSLRFVMPVIAVLALAACGDDDLFNAPTAPSGPAPTVTETFSGSINRNGAATHTFTTQASGTVTATLTTVTPDSELIVGFSVGTWNGTLCQIVLANDQAKQAAVVTGGVSALGSLCVRIYDVGNITDPISYEITVVHP